MTGLLDVDLHVEALFVSDVQRSQHPTAELIRAVVDATEVRLGETGCAGLVAQEFGDHPDCARHRMEWAIAAVQDAFALPLA
jgi:hypothetical protein